MSTLILVEEITLTHKELHVNTPTIWGADIDSQEAACQHSRWLRRRNWLTRSCMSTLMLVEELTLTHKEPHVNTPADWGADIDPQGSCMSTLTLIKELTLTHKEPHVNTPTGSMRGWHWPTQSCTSTLPLTDELHRRTTLNMHINYQKQLKSSAIYEAAATSKQ